MIGMTLALLTLFAVMAAIFPGLPRHDIHGDPLPEGALARFGTVRYRIGPFGAAILSPDGKKLAVESVRSVMLWEVDSGRPVVSLPIAGFRIDHYPLVPMAFSPDSQHLVRVWNKELRVWDAKTGNVRFVIQIPKAGWNIGFLSDPTLVAVTNGGSEAYVCDVNSGRLVSTIQAGADGLFVSRSGKHFIGFSELGWSLADTKTGLPQIKFRSGSYLYSGCALGPEDRLAHSVAVDGRLKTFDVKSGKLLEDLDPPTDWGKEDRAVGLAIAPDGTVAYLWKRSQPTRRRDLKVGKWLDPLPSMPEGQLIPHPDGKRVLFVGKDGILRRFDVATLPEVPPPDGFETTASAIPSPDGRWVIVSSGDWYQPRIDLFDKAGRLQWSLQATGIVMPTWSSDGGSLAFAGERDVIIREPKTGRVRRVYRPKESTLVDPRAFRFIAEGARFIVVGCERGNDDQTALATFETASGKLLISRRATMRGIADLSPDGCMLLLSGGGPSVALFDLVSNKFLVGWTDPVFDDGDARPLSPCFSPDGSYLLSWSNPTVAVLRDPRTATRKCAIDFGVPTPTEYAFSPDDRYLAIGREDGTWDLWDIASGIRLRRWVGHRDAITSVGFAGPGRVVTSSADLTCLTWDLRPTAKLSPPTWDAIRGTNPAEAYQAIWSFARDPSGPKILRESLGPAKPVARVVVDGLFADLGAERFRVREAAAKRLLELGSVIEPELRAMRKDV